MGWLGLHGPVKPHGVYLGAVSEALGGGRMAVAWAGGGCLGQWDRMEVAWASGTAVPPCPRLACVLALLNMVAHSHSPCSYFPSNLALNACSCARVQFFLTSGTHAHFFPPAHAQLPVRGRPEVRERIAAAIAQLGGQVVPKLNWSCPSDATWLNPAATLACGNAEQVTHWRGMRDGQVRGIAG